jgi:NAD(P)-dependent dehydrogenase (short-subunit alcohol dehydrogenase family)
MQLEEMRIAVTGGLGSLGRCVVQTLSSAGAKVAVIDQVASGSAPDGVLLYTGIDLCDVDEATNTFSRIDADLGGLNGLINIAGGFRWEKIAGGSIDAWDHMYSGNLRTAVSATQAALPHILKRGTGGRILNIGAAGAIKAGLGMGAYAASKAGVAKLTEALAEELKGSGITVNALLPSIIDTPRNRADMPKDDFLKWVTAEQLAGVIAFMMSGSAQAVTGALIPVTGGV